MVILKKLIVREWYSSFLGAAVILLMLLSVANLLNNFLRGNVNALDIMSNYLIELPDILTKVLPISCLVATLFSVNKLKNRNELTAIFASGLSRREFILTIAQAAAFVAMFQFVISAYLQPFVRLHKDDLIKDGAKKFGNLKSSGLKASTLASGKIWYKSNNYFFSFSAFDKTKKELFDVNVYYIDTNYNLRQRIYAKNAHHIIDNSWLFQQGVDYQYLSEKKFPSVTTFKELSVNLNESAADFTKIEADISILDLFQLWNYISSLNHSGINTNEYEVIYWDKFSSAVICLVFSLISIVSIFSPNRRGSSFGKSVGYVFIFVMVYWLIYSFSSELGKNSRLPPILACFGVPIIFMTYLSYVFWANKKLR